MQKKFKEVVNYYKQNKKKIWLRTNCVFTFLNLLDAIEKYLKEDWK